VIIAMNCHNIYTGAPDAAITSGYAWMSEAAYRRERARILTHFAQCDDLYATPWFCGRHSARARANLRRAVSRLESGHG
jgi:predicted metal-dependent HD superfamily phosphohydrolase